MTTTQALGWPGAQFVQPGPELAEQRRFDLGRKRLPGAEGPIGGRGSGSAGAPVLPPQAIKLYVCSSNPRRSDGANPELQVEDSSLSADHSRDLLQPVGSLEEETTSSGHLL